jgi:anaerobic sulfite reductase subunit C
MKWSHEAEAAISRVPFFVRKRVKKKVEEEAARQGARTVEMAHVVSCRNGFLNDMSSHVKGYQLEQCFGSSGCPNRLGQSADLVARLETLLAGQNLKGFLADRVTGPLKIHHEFRVTIADCPNACSRPQISDVGIIGVRKPFVSDEACSRCMSCVDVCAEDAVLLAEDAARPTIDPEKCLLCGQCVRECPSGTLVAGLEGYLLLAGGKLGRHPQLARQVGGVHSAAEILGLVEKCLSHFKAHNQRGERFGDILNRTGYAFLGELLRLSSGTMQ